jgi:hypothetical protein
VAAQQAGRATGRALSEPVAKRPSPKAPCRAIPDRSEGPFGVPPQPGVLFVDSRDAGTPGKPFPRESGGSPVTFLAPLGGLEVGGSPP